MCLKSAIRVQFIVFIEQLGNFVMGILVPINFHCLDIILNSLNAIANAYESRATVGRFISVLRWKCIILTFKH